MKINFTGSLIDVFRKLSCEITVPKPFFFLVMASLVLCSFAAQAAQIINTVAGTGVLGYNGDGIAATTAQLSDPIDVFVDTSGNIYIVSQSDHRVRKVDVVTGLISTVAGTGVSGYNGDGIAATTAQLYAPSGVCVDASGNIYIGDYANNRVRKVDAGTGLISTVAGTGVSGYNGDGIAATAAQLRGPFGVWVDASDNIYLADSECWAIRKVTKATGLISTVAGTPMSRGFSGDGNLATSAQIETPLGIFVDTSGTIYITGGLNQRVRKVEATTWKISTVAGTGSAGYNGDGIIATTAQISSPYDISVDASGNIYIADVGNQRIRKVDAGTGLISTVVGTGSTPFNGDGISPTTANIFNPVGVFVNASGNIYLASDQRIRKISSVNSPATVDLGMAGIFAVLAETAITTTGPTSIVGNVGISPAIASFITGFGLLLDGSGTFANSALVSGNVYASDYASPTPNDMIAAINDMMVAYADAAGRAPDVTELGAGNISGMTLAPGVYKWSTDVVINTDVTLSGSPTDVWIFQIAGDINTANAGSIATGTKVLLSGGAKAENVFWQVGGITGVDLGTYSTFTGNILSAKQIIMETGAELNGRALAQTQVALDTNVVYMPSANNAPATPSAPSGPGNGKKNYSYAFKTSATDPDGDQVKFIWDWNGDGAGDDTSALGASGSIQSYSHTFPSAGTYTVKVRSEDEHGFQSGWSAARTIVVTNGGNDISWTTVAALPSARQGAFAAVVGGKVYVLGGSQVTPYAILKTVDAYDPGTNTWASKADMLVFRAKAASAVLGATIYAIGGWNDGSLCLSSVEAYDTATDTWTAKASMSVVRHAPAAATVSGTIFVFGGSDSGGGIASVEAYSQETNTWVGKASMSGPRYGMAAVAVGGTIYIIGGATGASYTETTTVEAYYPRTNTWATRTSMPTARCYMFTAVVGGTIYVSGGWYGSGILDNVEAYDTATNSWTILSPLGTARADGASAAVGDSIYAIGGGNLSTVAYDTVDAGLVFGAPGGGANTAPNTPSTPTGPAGGEVSVSYAFATSTTDPDGNTVKYGWDFDSDSVVDQWSSLQASGTANSLNRSFATPGTYSVRVKAQDSLGAESGWSAGKTVVIATTASNLSGVLSVTPTPVGVGQVITASFRVNNSGSASVTGVMPLLTVTGDASPLGLTGPTPAGPFTVGAGAYTTIVWTFSATGSGNASFSAQATGTDSGTGLVVTVTGVQTFKISASAASKVAQGKLIIAPNSIDPTKPGGKIVFHFKGNAGALFEVMIFSSTGTYIGSFKGTIDSNGAGFATLSDAKLDGKSLATGFYWAQMKGGGVSDRKQFAVVYKKGK